MAGLGSVRSELGRCHWQVKAEGAFFWRMVRIWAGGRVGGRPGAERWLAAALLLYGACVVSAAVPPFWPEDNCINTMNGMDPTLNLQWGSAAINPFAGQFETQTYSTGIVGGPPFNSDAPCKITARVGDMVSFNVIAEDPEPGLPPKAPANPSLPAYPLAHCTARCCITCQRPHRPSNAQVHLL